MSKCGEVKKERKAPDPDKEVAVGTQKLLARPSPQMGETTSASGTPLAPIFNQPLVADPIPPHSGFDRDSAIGKFTWVTISDDKNVPCIFRNDDKYVSVRMAEISVIGELLNVLPCELYESAKITSYYVTPAEAKLLTYINSWHCDGFYGSEPFTLVDLVISLKELQKFYDFLFFAFCVLHSGGKNVDPEFRHCGFVHINSDSMIPYAVLDGDGDEKGVPLFFFKGQLGMLKNKAQSVVGYPLAYLKVCCKVQGVRKDLMSSSTLEVVTLSSLQAVFPKRTTFTEKCWLTPKRKSLLAKQSLLGVMHSALLQVPSDRWTRLERNETFPNFTTSTKTNSTNTATNSAVAMNPKNGIPHVTLSCNGIPTNYPIPETVWNGSPALAKIKISIPPTDKERSQLVSIREHPDGSRDGAYIVNLIVHEDKFMHCINSKPGQKKKEEFLVVLQELFANFLPTISIYPTAVSSLRSMNIVTYLPNRAQIKAFNNFGFQIQEAWQIPLVSVPKMEKFLSALLKQ